MLLLFIAGLFISNNILKKEYGKADKKRPLLELR